MGANNKVQPEQLSKRSETSPFWQWVFFFFSLFMEGFDIFTDVKYYESLSDNSICGFKETIPQWCFILLQVSIGCGTFFGFVTLFFQFFSLLVEKHQERAEGAKKLSSLGSKRCWLVRKLRALGQYCWMHDRQRSGWHSYMVWFSVLIFGLEDLLHLAVVAYVADKVGVIPESKDAFRFTLYTSTASSVLRCAMTGYKRFQKPNPTQSPPTPLEAQHLQRSQKGEPSPKSSQTDTASISQPESKRVSPKMEGDEVENEKTPVTAFNGADSLGPVVTKEEGGSDKGEQLSVWRKVLNIDFKKFSVFVLLTVVALGSVHAFIWTGNGTDVQVVAPSVEMRALLNSTNWGSSMEFNMVARLTGGLAPRQLFLDPSRVLDVDHTSLWIEQESTIRIGLDRFSENLGNFTLTLDVYFSLDGQRYCPCESVFLFSGTEATDGTWTIPSESRTQILAPAQNCGGFSPRPALCSDFSATIPQFGVEYVGSPTGARALEEGCTLFTWTGPFCERNETNGGTVAEVADCGGSIIRSDKEAGGLVFYGSNDIEPFQPSVITGCFVGGLARQSTVTIESDDDFVVLLDCEVDNGASGASQMGALNTTNTLANSGTRRIQFIGGSGTVSVRLDSGDVGTVALSAGNGIDCDTSRSTEEAMIALASNTEAVGVQWESESSSAPIPQASPSPTSTMSVTPSETRTPTSTRTASASSTSTSSSTPSSSRSTSPTVTASTSPTVTASTSCTPSTSSSRTATKSTSSTGTSSRTQSVTPSITPTKRPVFAVRINDERKNQQRAQCSCGLRNAGDEPGSAGFVVVWETTLDGGETDIMFKIYSPYGLTVKNDTSATQSAAGSKISPDVTCLYPSGFVVGWYTDKLAQPDHDIIGRFFDNSGVPLSDNFRLSSSSAGDQTRPELSAFHSREGFVCVWQAQSDGESYGVDTRVFASSNNASESFAGDVQRANVHTKGFQGAGQVCTIPSTSDFVVVWVDSGGNATHVYMRKHTDGAFGDVVQVSSNVTGSNTDARIACIEDGKVAVSWMLPDGSSKDVAYKVYDSNLNIVHDQTVANQVTNGLQRYPTISEVYPAEFVIAWSSLKADSVCPSNEDIVMRRFSSDGTALSFDQTIFDAGLECSNGHVGSWRPHANRLLGTEFQITWSQYDHTDYGDVNEDGVPGAGDVVKIHFL